MTPGIDELVLAIPEDRREPIRKLYQTIAENIPVGFAETTDNGMPAWVVPHTIYPGGYHCYPKSPLPYLWLSNTKAHVAIHAFGLYVDADRRGWLDSEAKQRGINLDMGKACIRFKKPDQIPHDLIADLVRNVSVEQFVSAYAKLDPRNK